MAGEPPPNLLNAEQIRELLSRVPSRISNPQGDELYDVRPIRTTQGRWGIRDGIWSRDERDALEATYTHYTGRDIDLSQLHRSEYEHLSTVMESIINTRQLGPTAPGAIVSSEGPRNFDLDKAIVDRVIEHLSNARAHRVGMPLDDVANIRALYVAYGMEERIYGLPTTTLEGQPIRGAVTAPEGQYTARELNNLGELRRQILHARTRGFVTRPEEEAEPDVSPDTEAVSETNPEIEVTELPPLDETREGSLEEENEADGPDETVDETSPEGVDETVEDVEQTVEETPDRPRGDADLDVPDEASLETGASQGRMTIIGEGEGWEPYNAEVEKLQTALVIAGYDVGTFPDHMAKAGEPLIDGYEGVLTRGAVTQAVSDLKELGIEVDPRTTPLNDFIARLEDPETALRLQVLHETRAQENAETPGNESVDYQERARELALSGDGLTSKTDFDDASANTTDVPSEPQPKVEFDMSVPTEESLTPR